MIVVIAGIGIFVLFDRYIVLTVNGMVLIILFFAGNRC
jgi:hypothetical protein